MGLLAMIFFIGITFLGVAAYIFSNRKKQKIEYIWVGRGENPVKDMKY